MKRDWTEDDSTVLVMSVPHKEHVCGNPDLVIGTIWRCRVCQRTLLVCASGFDKKSRRIPHWRVQLIEWKRKRHG